MSTANNCDCRFKVDWEDLSPTLQARLLKIEKDIVLIKSEISKINQNIQDILRKINILENRVNNNENKIINLSNKVDNNSQNIQNINNQINIINQKLNNQSSSNDKINNIQSNIDSINDTLKNMLKITGIGDGLKFENGILSAINNTGNTGGGSGTTSDGITGSLYVSLTRTNVKHNDGTTITFTKPFKHIPCIYVYGESRGTHVLIRPVYKGGSIFGGGTLNPGLTNTYARIRIPVWGTNYHSDNNYAHDAMENIVCIAIGLV